RSRPGSAEPEHEATRAAMEVKVAVELARERLNHCQAGRGAARFRRGNGTVEGDDWGGLHAFKRSIEEIDLAPVGVLRTSGAGMHCRNGGLDLVGAGAAMPHGLANEGYTLGDELLIPELAILLLEQHH